MARQKFPSPPSRCRFRVILSLVIIHQEKDKDHFFFPRFNKMERQIFQKLHHLFAEKFKDSESNPYKSARYNILTDLSMTVRLRLNNLDDTMNDDISIIPGTWSREKKTQLPLAVFHNIGYLVIQSDIILNRLGFHILFYDTKSETFDMMTYSYLKKRTIEGNLPREMFHRLQIYFLNLYSKAPEKDNNDSEKTGQNIQKLRHDFQMMQKQIKALPKKDIKQFVLSSFSKIDRRLGLIEQKLKRSSTPQKIYKIGTMGQFLP